MILLLIISILTGGNITRSNFLSGDNAQKTNSNTSKLMDNTDFMNKYEDENVHVIVTYPIHWAVSAPYVGSYPDNTWVVDFSPQLETGALIKIVTRPVDTVYPTSDVWASGTLSSNY